MKTHSFLSEWDFHLKVIMMDMEDPGGITDISDSKLRRLKFFEDIGFTPTKYRLSNGDVMFRVLSNTGGGDIWKYIDFLDMFCSIDNDGKKIDYVVYKDGVAGVLQRGVL